MEPLKDRPVLEAVYCSIGALYVVCALVAANQYMGWGRHKRTIQERIQEIDDSHTATGVNSA